jgi:hypothetical protein
MQTFTDKKTGSLCNELNLLATYNYESMEKCGEKGDHFLKISTAKL